MAITVKRYNLLFLFFLMLNNLAEAQRYYQFQLNDEYLGDVQLQLDKAGKYLMASESAVSRSGFMESRAFSYGSYEENEKTIILKDEQLDYRMVLKKKNDKLKCVICFPFLNHGKFKYTGSNLDSLFWTTVISLNKDSREDSFRSHNLIAPIDIESCRPDNDTLVTLFKEGIYGVSGYNLSINRYWQGHWFEFKNGKYNAYFNKFKLSSGAYALLNNSLILKDQTLDVDFVLGFESDSVLYAKKFISNIFGDCFFRYIQSRKEANKKFTNPKTIITY